MIMCIYTRLQYCHESMFHILKKKNKMNVTPDNEKGFIGFVTSLISTNTVLIVTKLMNVLVLSD
jgi:hypothetical protein